MFNWLGKNKKARIREIENYKAAVQMLERILRDFFHEAIMPMRNLDRDLNDLSKQITKEKGRNYLNNALNNFERLKAIFERSRNLFTEGEDSGDIGVESQRIVNVNALIETAIRKIKADIRDINFKASYAANCYIDCLPTEVVQMLFVLFKNGNEAYEDTDLKKEIFIRTSREKSVDDASKNVKVEIEHHATGIDPIISEFMWEQGFATKNRAFGGIGLSILKEIAGHYGGVTFESPIINKNGNKIKGAKFILSFKQKAST